MKVPSQRRNPVIADIFSRLNYMERRGSGFKKIIEDYEFQSNYSPKYKPVFQSENNAFYLTLWNMNYQQGGQVSGQVSGQVGGQDDIVVKLDNEHLKALLDYCSEAKSRKEMQEFCGIKSLSYFRDQEFIEPN